MRVFLEIVRFQLRQQFVSLFVWGCILVSFILHFLTIGSVGITLWTHPQADVNSIYAVAVVHSTLTMFNVLPVIVLVTNAFIRDYERDMASLFFVKPIYKWQYFGARFVAAFLLAAFLGLSGVLGSLIGCTMPWVDHLRLAAFSWQPFLFSFGYIVLPNLFTLCALFFSIAALTRSLPFTVTLAAVLITLNALLGGVNLNSDISPKSVVLADYSAMLVIDHASRNLSITDLNTLYPTALLFENRLLWLALSVAALAFSYKRFCLKIGETQARRWRFTTPFLRTKNTQRPANAPYNAAFQISNKNFATLYAQVRMDFSATVFNPLFLFILALVIGSAIIDYNDHVSPVMKSVLRPFTSARLDFFRYGLLHLVLLVAVYFSAALIHREQESGITELVGASPVADWVLPVAKTLALCASVILLLFVAMLTSIMRQLIAGGINPEIWLYLRVVFVHNGFYYCMLCILAVLVQIIVPNKWLGMLAVLIINIFLLSLQALGFEHILYRYAIPTVTYSDMNGFGKPGAEVYILVAYWSFFCALLIILGYLLYPRGTDRRFKRRILAAADRIKPSAIMLASLFFTGFVITGGWIFYNTNVLQAYRTSGDIKQAQADYERYYGKYENDLTPSLSTIDIAFDIFPEQLRMESRGRAVLTNNKRQPITRFVISVDPRLKVHLVNIDSATIIKADTAMGLYLFKPHRQLLPGATLTMHWHLDRHNLSFSERDDELLENGTFINGYAAMPIPGFDDTRKLTDNTLRKKFGLPQATGLSPLNDTKSLERIAYGIDGRADFHIVVGTNSSQIAVAPGKLKRQWNTNGRRYFEYVSERPTWPKLYFLSARYQVERQTWSGQNQQVELEVYYDPKHKANVKAIMSTAKRTLNYLTREFGPYPYSVYRTLEYPRYRNAAQALPGGAVAYSEGVGWLADWSNLGGTDYTTIHELAHKWWGEQAYGASVKGREVLNETLAQYSTLMIIKEFDGDHGGPHILNKITVDLQSNYLRARNKDTKPELPLMYTDGQGYVSYNKGALALYRLQELAGEKTVNRALRNYLQKFAFKPAPFPTSKDLVTELRAAAGPAYDALITELFEKIVTFDFDLTYASMVKTSQGYQVLLSVLAKQFVADSSGRETQVPVRAWVDVGLFLNNENGLENHVPVYLSKHLLKSGVNTIKIHLKQKPSYSGIDPFGKMPDKEPLNNALSIKNMR